MTLGHYIIGILSVRFMNRIYRNCGFYKSFNPIFKEIEFMPYPEMLIKPMREDLTRLGIEEARAPEAVDAAIRETEGTLMIVVNSVCGCAAGKARPGVALALNHSARPDRSITVF